MALIVVAADKGAPGVTTTAVTLAAVWPRPVLLAECDPAGGDVIYRLPAADGGRLDPRRGMLSLAVAARRGFQPGQVWEHTQKLRGGLDVLTGVTNAEQGAGLDPMWGQVGAALAGLPQADVIADCGRIGPEGRPYDLLARADAVVLVARASLADMVRLRDRVSVVEAALRRRAGTASRIGVVVIADHKHFSAALAEVRQVLGKAESPVAVLGGLAFEPKSAELLSGQWGGKLDKSLLIRTAREIASNLAAQIPPSQPYGAEQAALPAPGQPAPDLLAPEAAGSALPVAEPATAPSGQQRRGRRGITDPGRAGPEAPAAGPVIPAASAGRRSALPPARDWAQTPPAAASRSVPGWPPDPASADPLASEIRLRETPWPARGPVVPEPPLAGLPPLPPAGQAGSAEPVTSDGPAPASAGAAWGVPAGSAAPPTAPPLAASPPAAAPGSAGRGWPGSSAPEPAAAPRSPQSWESAGQSQGYPRSAPPDQDLATAMPLRQVPGDQTAGGAVLPPLPEASREPGRSRHASADRPAPGPGRPGTGLAGPGYASPGWHRAGAPAGRAERGPSHADTAPGVAYPTAGRAGHQQPDHQPVLRGTVLPSATPPGYQDQLAPPARPQRDRPARQQPEARQSDWWAAPDPMAPAEHAGPDHSARGHGAGDHGAGDHGAGDHRGGDHRARDQQARDYRSGDRGDQVHGAGDQDSREHGEHGPARHGGEWHTGAPGGSQAPAAEPGGW